MTRSFADPQSAAVYSRYRGRHVTDDVTRTAGDGLGAAYRRGFLHGAEREQYVRGSLARAAWAAGVDDAREVKRKA